MGIRVVCPNGHRLHLKTQLAGRRGLCPDCGARFRIPTESSDQPQPFAEPPARPAGATAVPVDTSAGSSGPAPSTTSAAPTTQIHAPQPQAEAGAIPMAMPVPSSQPAVTSAASPSVGPNATVGTSPAVPMPQVPTQTPAMGPAVGPPAAAVPASVDPLSAAPHALWYVQPPTGGRYGPAKADVMRQWIVEGRITEDCLVWRDGWSEWQSASTILGSGSTGETPVGNGVPADFQPGSGSISSRRRGKRSKGFGVSMIIILGLACLGLLALLFVLISNGTISLAPSLPVE